MDESPEQRSRSKAGRWIARALVVAVLIGLAVLVYSLISSGVSDYRDNQAADEQLQQEERQDRRREERKQEAELEDGPATYVVQDGDTLTMISQDTGLTLKQLSELNPDLDSRVLSPGQEIKLR